MPGSVGQFFLRNWLLKLAAVFFAVMLYVAVAAQQPLTETFALRLSVAPPPGRALRQAPPSIAVTVQGKGSEILKLRNIPRTISKTVPDTLTGSLWRLHLLPGDITLPKGVEVQVSDISPRDVDIVVDSAARRDVRIAPRVTLEKDSGFALLGITAVPPTARLIGPPKSLAGVESVTTQPTQIASVPGPVYRTVALDTQALGVARITPREVRLVAEVAALAQRVFAGVPVATAASGFAGWELVSERVQVSVGGPAARVERLTRDSLRVVAHLVRPGAPGGYARLSVQAPSGITARASPDSVALKRKGGLSVGVVYARPLAYAGARALIGVHHMEGPLFAPAVEDPELAPPFVALLVSGGHTLLLDVPAWGRYRLLGQTRDDAAGEAFDKGATLLGLGYPGGPAIERLAVQGYPARVSFPGPLREEGVEFSFSGLKTAVLRAVRASTDLERDRPHLARAFQDAVLDVLVTKLERAVRLTGYRTAVLGGGVACSRALATLATERLAGLARVAVASPRLNVDNAAMIARAGWRRLGQGERSDWTLDARTQ